MMIAILFFILVFLFLFVGAQIRVCKPQISWRNIERNAFEYAEKSPCIEHLHSETVCFKWEIVSYESGAACVYHTRQYLPSRRNSSFRNCPYMSFQFQPLPRCSPGNHKTAPVAAFGPGRLYSRRVRRVMLYHNDRVRRPPACNTSVSLWTSAI